MNFHDTIVSFGGEFIIALGLPGILGITFYILWCGTGETKLKRFI